MKDIVEFTCKENFLDHKQHSFSKISFLLLSTKYLYKLLTLGLRFKIKGKKSDYFWLDWCGVTQPSERPKSFRIHWTIELKSGVQKRVKNRYINACKEEINFTLWHYIYVCMYTCMVCYVRPLLSTQQEWLLYSMIGLLSIGRCVAFMSHNLFSCSIQHFLCFSIVLRSNLKCIQYIPQDISTHMGVYRCVCVWEFLPLFSS